MTATPSIHAAVPRLIESVFLVTLDPASVRMSTASFPGLERIHLLFRKIRRYFSWPLCMPNCSKTQLVPHLVGPKLSREPSWCMPRSYCPLVLSPDNMDQMLLSRLFDWDKTPAAFKQGPETAIFDYLLDAYQRTYSSGDKLPPELAAVSQKARQICLSYMSSILEIPDMFPQSSEYDHHRVSRTTLHAHSGT
jgi:hypothetical protein